MLDETKTEKAIVLSLIAYAAFSVSDGVRKIATQEYQVIDILFWQAIVGISIIILLTPFMGGINALFGRGAIKMHGIRGMLFALNTGLSLVAISRIPLMDAYTIFFLTPFAMSIIGAALFKEKIGKPRIISIACGFIGAFIAFRPGFVELNSAYLYAFACIFTFSFASVLTRFIDRSTGLLAFAFWPFLYLIIGIFLYNGGHIPEFHGDWFPLHIVLAGTAYAMALLTISYSYTLASAIVLAPYQYVQIVFALAFGYFVSGYIPDMAKAIGSTIIVGSGLVLIARERKAKRAMMKKIEN